MKLISCNQQMGGTQEGFCAQEPHKVLLGISNLYLLILYGVGSSLNRL